MSDESFFICPSCKVNLDFVKNTYICKTCSSEYPLDFGVANFSEHDFYWNQLPRNEMKSVISSASEVGWEKSIEGKFNPSVTDYIHDYSRGDWLNYVPLNKKSVVLDVGCGWGINAIQLSKWCKKVYALDSTIETLKFLKIRAEQEGIKNIIPIAGNPLDYPSLPFSENTFDLIVLNGVVEWIGSSDKKTNPQKLQLKALKYLGKLLKPGGRIYIGIENRYSYALLLGTRVHDELPFISILPRFLSNIITRLFRGERHRTYIHTRKEYLRMLEETGYKKISFFWPRPNYRDPTMFIPLKNKVILKYWSNFIMTSSTYRQKLFKNIFSKFNKTNIFMSSFSIIAEKK